MIRKSVMFVMIVLGAAFIASASAADDMPVLPEYQFVPSNTVLQDVDEKRNAAISKNKRLLVVFGAQWCHDSRGLSQRFSTPKMHAILQQQYETVFVDVGYFSKGFEAIKQLNQTIFYATPTVLIIDPKTNTVLNQASIMHWTNADSLELAEYQDYFSQDFALLFKAGMGDTALLAYLEKIRQFENRQATRLYRAYQIIEPLLKRYEETDNGSTYEFKHIWSEVKSYRTAIPSDIAKLIK